jgi:hypothetical protein
MTIPAPQGATEPTRVVYGTTLSQPRVCLDAEALDRIQQIRSVIQQATGKTPSLSLAIRYCLMATTDLLRSGGGVSRMLVDMIPAKITAARNGL